MRERRTYERPLIWGAPITLTGVDTALLERGSLHLSQSTGCFRRALKEKRRRSWATQARKIFEDNSIGFAIAQPVLRENRGEEAEESEQSVLSPGISRVGVARSNLRGCLGQICLLSPAADDDLRKKARNKAACKHTYDSHVRRMAARLPTLCPTIHFVSVGIRVRISGVSPARERSICSQAHKRLACGRHVRRMAAGLMSPIIPSAVLLKKFAVVQCRNTAGSKTVLSITDWGRGDVPDIRAGVRRLWTCAALTESRSSDFRKRQYDTCVLEVREAEDVRCTCERKEPTIMRAPHFRRNSDTAVHLPVAQGQRNRYNPSSVFVMNSAFCDRVQ
ncbi:hypothetical protein B0H17DRAFT_1288273 [Mycena rosella]|uniref:Uncharacterized protein n=1 Tax=Mycena rosella TaxID=1033263 RepID=A0AAD7GHC5_MYCRO|nr:hypothetical protein B0H17DRAFT_1288273 [Mycena rosella]